MSAPQNAYPPRSIRLDSGQRRTHLFAVAPPPEARAALAADLGIEAIRKLVLEGELAPDGHHDWVLTARLGATVVQTCGVTLAPVTTRIDETVTRRYLANPPVPDHAGEVEMPEDDSVEELPASLDLTQVMAEALSLALPLHPRAEGVELGEAVFTEPGRAPMRDEDARPFAALGALRNKLDGGDGE